MAATCKDCPKLSRPRWSFGEGPKIEPAGIPVCQDIPNENYARRINNIRHCTRYRLHLHNYAKNNAEIRS